MAGSTAGVKFRREIEGLRGLLVLLVIVFHAGVPAFEGGYFAVDIFFVVSGYLMALIILADMSASRFSVIGFYERRARRIFPALYLVIGTSLVCAYYLMPPAEYEDMAKSAVWVLGMAGNIYFSVSSSSYFDADMGLQPFMHLWTLGLEQQYYLLIPLCFALCFFAWRRLNINVLLASLALGSFGVALLIVYNDVQTAFYLLASRLWEFLLGSLLAINEPRLRAIVPEKIQPWLADAGAALVIIVCATATVFMAHPGPITLLPVFGAMLYLGLATERSVFSRVLGLKPLLQLGAISYSLYLWHQVFFALARWYEPHTLTGLDYFGLVVAAVLVSVVTYHLVEVPFRNQRQVTPKAFWVALALITVPLYYTAEYVDKKRGLEQRLPETVRNYYQPQHFRDVSRTAGGIACYDVVHERPCPIGLPDEPRTWALVGDSHAAALTSEVDRVFRELKIGGYSMFRNICPLSVGSRLIGDREDLCGHHNKRVMERLMQSDIKGVVITGRYAYLLDERPYDNGEGGVETGRQWWFDPSAQRVSNREEAILNSFVEPVRQLLEAGKLVVLIDPLPEMGWSVPDYQFKVLMRDGALPDISISLERYLERIGPVAEAFDSLGAHDNLVRIRPGDLFCDEVAGRCHAQRNGRLLYRDDDHINDLGAAVLVDEVMRGVEALSLTDRIVTRF